MNKDIELSPRITEIVMFYFYNPHLTYTELAKHFEVSLARISQIMNHPKVLNSYPILAKRRLKALVPRAIKRAEELMDQSINLQVSEKVVGKILDSEKVLEPVERKIIHEVQLKTIRELQAIVDEAKALPKPVIEAELIEEEKHE